MYVCVVCVHMSAGTHRGQRHGISLELDEQIVASHWIQVLGTELRSSAGAAVFTVELQVLLWFLLAGLCRAQSLVLYTMHFLGNRNYRDWKPTCIPSITILLDPGRLFYNPGSYQWSLRLTPLSCQTLATLLVQKQTL